MQTAHDREQGHAVEIVELEEGRNDRERAHALEVTELNKAHHAQQQQAEHRWRKQETALRATIAQQVEHIQTLRDDYRRLELRQMGATLSVQKAARGLNARTMLHTHRGATIRVQAATRGMVARSVYDESRQAAITVQSAWRGAKHRTELGRLHVAAVNVQQLFRKHRARNRVRMVIMLAQRDRAREQDRLAARTIGAGLVLSGTR